MQLESIIKVIAALAAIIGIGKGIYEINIGKRSRLREDYKFAKDFLEELKRNPDLHPFVLEKGYQAIAGTTTVSKEEISYLLSLKDPSRCLNDYLLAKKYLDKLKTEGYLQLAFSKKYSSPWSRKWKKSLHLALYAIFALFALAPFFLPTYAHLIIVTVPGFGYFAYLFLDTYTRIYRGEKLVQNQKKHTPSIHLPPQSNRFLQK